MIKNESEGGGGDGGGLCDDDHVFKSFVWYFLIV